MYNIVRLLYYGSFYIKCCRCNYEKYDTIIMADIPENTPKRFHITKSNEYMVNNSDFLICYIQRTWGGAVSTYKYAKRKKLQIFNVAEKPIEII